MEIITRDEFEELILEPSISIDEPMVPTPEVERLKEEIG